MLLSEEGGEEEEAGVYGVGFGRSALSPACSGDMGGGGDMGGLGFDVIGYDELVSALGAEASHEIEEVEASRHVAAAVAATQRGVGHAAAAAGRVAAGGGDET